MNSLISLLFMTTFWSTSALDHTLDLDSVAGPPDEHGPVVVQIGAYIQNIHFISEKNMDYSFTMSYRETWKDHRIKINSSVKKLSYKVPTSLLKNVWMPDIFIPNEKDGQQHNHMTETRLFRIRENDGAVWHVRTLTATISCPMNFEKFPFDTQICPLRFESYSYTADSIELRWMTYPVQLNDQINIFAKYSLQNVTLINCSQNYTTGSYPCLSANFVLKRNTGHYVCSFFLPTIVFVILAWLSFWININSSMARIILPSIAIYFTIVTSYEAKSELPTISYMTVLDTWTIICSLFIVYSLVIHVVVNCLIKTHFSSLLPSADVNKNVESDHESVAKLETGTFFENLKGFLLEERQNRESDSEKNRRMAHFINTVSRLVFPLVFVFVIIVFFAAVTRSDLQSLVDEFKKENGLV